MILSLFLSLCLRFSIPFPVSIFLSQSLFVCPSVPVPVHFRVHLPLSLSRMLSLYCSLCPSVPIHVLISLPLFSSLCLFVSLFPILLSKSLCSCHSVPVPIYLLQSPYHCTPVTLFLSQCLCSCPFPSVHVLASLHVLLFL